MTQNENLFVCAIEQNTLVLCERHAKAFELAAMLAKTPHTIVELDDSDIAEGMKCHACDLEDELTRPRIIIGN